MFTVRRLSENKIKIFAFIPIAGMYPGIRYCSASSEYEASRRPKRVLSNPGRTKIESINENKARVVRVLTALCRRF